MKYLILLAVLLTSGYTQTCEEPYEYFFYYAEEACGSRLSRVQSDDDLDLALAYFVDNVSVTSRA